MRIAGAAQSIAQPPLLVWHWRVLFPTRGRRVSCWLRPIDTPDLKNGQPIGIAQVMGQVFQSAHYQVSPHYPPFRGEGICQCNEVRGIGCRTFFIRALQLYVIFRSRERMIYCVLQSAADEYIANVFLGLQEAFLRCGGRTVSRSVSPIRS